MVRKYGKYGDNSPIYYLFTQFFMAMKVGTIPKIRAQKNISRQFLSRRKNGKTKETYKPISQPENQYLNQKMSAKMFISY